jgi:rare lipoprotein A (peptidoglycan hydrolase)
MELLARLIVFVGLLAGVVVIGGCSTFGLRGQTQSVAGVGATFRNDGLNDRGPNYTAPRYNLSDRHNGARAYQPPRQSMPIDRYSVPAPALVHRGAPEYGAARPPANGGYARGDTNVPPARQADRWADDARNGVERGRMSFAPARNPNKPPSQIKRPASNSVPVYVRSGLASWMGSAWVGHTTATGEAFDPNQLTAAHATLPVPSYLYVTNRANGRTVLVRVNDRVPARKERVVAISQMSANLLGFQSLDQVQVELQYAGPAGAVGDGQHEEAFLKRQPWFRRSMLRQAQTASAPRASGPMGTRGQPAQRYGSPIGR